MVTRPEGGVVTSATAPARQRDVGTVHIAGCEPGLHLAAAEAGGLSRGPPLVPLARPHHLGGSFLASSARPSASASVCAALADAASARCCSTKARRSPARSSPLILPSSADPALTSRRSPALGAEAPSRPRRAALSRGGDLGLDKEAARIALIAIVPVEALASMPDYLRGQQCTEYVLPQCGAAIAFAKSDVECMATTWCSGWPAARGSPCARYSWTSTETRTRHRTSSPPTSRTTTCRSRSSTTAR